METFIFQNILLRRRIMSSTKSLAKKDTESGKLSTNGSATERSEPAGFNCNRNRTIVITTCIAAAGTILVRKIIDHPSIIREHACLI